MPKNIENFIEALLERLNDKQKKVIRKRFGLQGKKETLQEIGDLLGVTRERIRQIESQALHKIRKEAKSELRELTEIAKRHLESSGGAREDKTFVEEVRNLANLEKNAPHIENKVRFFFFAAGEPFYARETNDAKSFWHKDKSAKDKLHTFVDGIHKTFKDGDKKQILKNKKFVQELIDEPYHEHFLFISKKFDKNSFGDFGLSNWPEIRPKNIRDKAYLAVQKNEKPLHFEHIAELIHKSGISARPVNIQTVHNELIKDKRFVLVGRGIYGLKEHGYNEGTVRDVIAGLIKQNGPLASGDVVKLVNQKRFLKENTILLNLQNRKHFKRLQDGTYDLQSA